MNRREALRLLATSAALPLAPHSLLAALRQAREVVGTATAPRSLNPHQFATVKVMAEMILPRTDTPGATDVGTAEFIDLMLTEWYEEPERSRFLKGLAEVDDHTKSLFNKDFIDCSGLQQAECLTVMGEKMAEETERLRDQPRRYRGALLVPDVPFYSMLRYLTLSGYYTSEAGATQALNFQIIPDRHEACAELTTIKQNPENQ